jgi:medium-chain acyl-[acyl-carrier-protein] hydrolase
MTALGGRNRWEPPRQPGPQARIRLFCFPYAGGGASIFRDWAQDLPDFVEVCPVQLPGRENRFQEALLTCLEPLIEALAGELAPQLDPPFAFFGHSMGALVAFELARRLHRDGRPLPARLLVAGCGAPSIRTQDPPMHTLPDAEFRSRLRGLNGTPAAVFDDDELMELLLPNLRADIGLCETYTFIPGPRLTCPISAWGGLGDDTVSHRELDVWREHTIGPFRLRMLPGDHFFLRTAQPLLLRGLAQELFRVVTAARPDRPDRAPRWEPTGEPPALGGEEVHLWRVSLDQPEETSNELRRLLSAEEEERARRFYYHRDCERFVVCRGTLRVLLGRYLGHSPQRLRFTYGAHGKPALAGGGLGFNVSHSEDLALIAVARNREVGVDLERVRPEVATQEIAARYFSAQEIKDLQALPRRLRSVAFFNCWTRKEAYLKATGIGLALPLDRFDVTLCPGEPAALLANRDDPSEVRRWTLRHLSPQRNFMGALAVEGPITGLWCGHWGKRTAAPEPYAACAGDGR